MRAAMGGPMRSLHTNASDVRSHWATSWGSAAGRCEPHDAIDIVQGMRSVGQSLVRTAAGSFDDIEEGGITVVVDYRPDHGRANAPR